MRLINETWLQTWDRLGLNNFHMKFPTAKHPNGWIRDVAKMNGNWDKPIEEGDSRNSRKFLAMTYAEFYADLDATVLEVIGNRHDFYAELELFKSGDINAPGWEYAAEHACKGAWRIASAMFEKGYTLQDLAA